MTDNKKGASSWNNGSWSWEERDFSDWSSKHLKTTLTAVHKTFSDASGNGLVQITAVTTVSGDAYVLFLHGKKRLGFDLEIKTTFKGEAGGASFPGKLNVKLESDTGGEPEWEWSWEKGSSKLVSDQLKAAVTQVLNDWKAELLNK